MYDKETLVGRVIAGSCKAFEVQHPQKGSLSSTPLNIKHIFHAYASKHQTPRGSQVQHARRVRLPCQVNPLSGGHAIRNMLCQAIPKKFSS